MYKIHCKHLYYKKRYQHTLFFFVTLRFSIWKTTQFTLCLFSYFTIFFIILLGKKWASSLFDTFFFIIAHVSTCKLFSFYYNNITNLDLLSNFNFHFILPSISLVKIRYSSDKRFIIEKNSPILKICL